MTEKLKKQTAMSVVRQVVFFENGAKTKIATDLPWNYTLGEAANVTRLLSHAKMASDQPWQLFALVDRELIKGGDAINELVDAKSTLILARDDQCRLSTEVSDINDCHMLRSDRPVDFGPEFDKLILSLIGDKKSEKAISAEETEVESNSGGPEVQITRTLKRPMLGKRATRERTIDSLGLFNRPSPLKKRVPDTAVKPTKKSKKEDPNQNSPS